MLKSEMTRRKPVPKYRVTATDGRLGYVLKNMDSEKRCERWLLASDDGEQKYFKSRRAAFHFFETGEKFETKPVYMARGKVQKRIR